MTDRKQLERYLLGGMTEDEREVLEREYFNDRRLFEEVVRAENELVDEYARGLLAPNARERFEQNYLSHPARRERARFAEALAAKIDRTNEVAAAAPGRTQTSWADWLTAWRGPRLIWGVTTALLLFASITAMLVYRVRRSPPETSIAEVGRPARERPAGESQQQRPAVEQTPSDDRAAEANNARAEQPPAPPAPTPTATKATPAFVTLTLAVAGTRGSGEGPATLEIPARTGHVRLRLNMRESDYARYSVVLRAVGGGEVFERGQLTPRNTKSGASLSLDVPARLLPAGDYVLTLKGVGETGEVEEVSRSLISVERR